MTPVAHNSALLRTGTRALGAVTALTLAAAYFRPSVLFAWHPTFMAVGFLGLMTDGIVRAVMLRPLEKAERVAALQAHAYVQAGPHFTSWHGQLGLAVVALSAASALMGATSFKKLGLLSYFPEDKHRSIKYFHRSLGAVTWLASTVVILLGLPHPAVDKGLVTVLWQLTVACMVVMVCVLLLRDAPPGAAAASLLPEYRNPQSPTNNAKTMSPAAKKKARLVSMELSGDKRIGRHSAASLAWHGLTNKVEILRNAAWLLGSPPKGKEA
eukprot:CAMPEP_0117658842 /NCGR_PEP_ID=MMETSP0804-20121206/6087_1 /TAXON_ID=1074897 /ORGANISM="Tetraselmis astigmatica, Strain CCMP880" /LENGTH=268 /DNA_ID=CAMNT_0005465405 /DNA_START=81 /DNA_END=888 /DNA_ORIENTATION=+